MPSSHLILCRLLLLLPPIPPSIRVFPNESTLHMRWPKLQFSSVAQSCPTLCKPMNRSTPGLPVHHLPEFTQTQVHRVRDAIQSCPTLRSHGLQHARLPCPSPTPETCSNSSPLRWLCYPAIKSSVISSSCLQSFPALRPFPMSQFFASGGQSIGVSASASVFPMNT